MPRVLIPAKIRPHLVPFLFREFPGIDANFNGKKVKAAKVSTRNTLGKLIRLLAEQSDKPGACDKRYPIFLSIEERSRRNEVFGKIYRYTDGTNRSLMLPEEAVVMINEYLEGIFRTYMMSYLIGWEEKKGEASIMKGINRFVEKYNLLEFGFDPNSIRRNYYRWKKDEKRLSFFINQASNRVHNY